MSKIFKKIAAIALAGVMAMSMAGTAAASSTATCPPHQTTKTCIGTNYTALLYSHDFVYEVRDGEIIMRTCNVYEIESVYVYQCLKCGKNTSATWTERRTIHSKCGQ